MPYRSMSLEEFAKHVSMDMRDVRRLADRGKLPGQKLAGQWRFNRARVTEWLQQEMHTLDEPRLVALEKAMGVATAEEPSRSDLRLTDMIGLEGIDLSLPAKTKNSVLRELVRLAGRTGLVYDDAGLLDALEQRESLCSTALPKGVAIPHPRQPMPYVSAEPFVCVSCIPSGIGFGAPDGGLTRLFFLVCCHTDRFHLRVLARLMRILDNETIALVVDARDPKELLEVLIAREKRVLEQTKP
ncbi:MAG: PTS sugar transporter subunit IIA [Phycisphaerales bacterium]|nr:MAG: PTS sugar transporter subunit IIA [Phycisphaerales bacterium]